MNRRREPDHPSFSFFFFFLALPSALRIYVSLSAQTKWTIYLPPRGYARFSGARPIVFRFASPSADLTEQITECATSAHSRATPRTKWRSLVKATSFLNHLLPPSLYLSLSFPPILSHPWPLRSIIHGHSPHTILPPRVSFPLSPDEFSDDTRRNLISIPSSPPPPNLAPNWPLQKWIDGQRNIDAILFSLFFF